MPPTTWSAVSSTMWVSGRKLRVVGRSGPDVSISVPVSAIAASAGVSETSSLPSLRPLVTSSSGRVDQGRSRPPGSGATRSFAGRFSRAR